MPVNSIFVVFESGNDNTLTPSNPLLQSRINIDFLKVTFRLLWRTKIMTNKITYTKQGDYLLPNLKLPEQPKVEIGIWGRGSPVETSAAGRSTDRADRRDSE